MFYDLVEAMTFKPTAWQSRQSVTGVTALEMSIVKTSVETSKFLQVPKETPEISTDTVTR